MKTALSPLTLRILGCLLEKQMTMPEQYPLSLNACNQKSNREPVMNLTESRVAKYEQRFCNSTFGNL